MGEPAKVALANGITLPADVMESLRGLAGDLNYGKLARIGIRQMASCERKEMISGQTFLSA